MPRQTNYNWQPDRSSHSGYKNSWSNKNNNRMDWDAINNKADDQIAPSHAASSIENLQRWALVTATLPQQGHHFKEGFIIDRIQRRYQDADARYDDPTPRYSNIEEHLEPKKIEEPLDDKHAIDDSITSSEPTQVDTLKRLRSISPPPPDKVPATGLSAVARMRMAKRPRVNSPSPSPSPFPGSGEDYKSVER